MCLLPSPAPNGCSTSNLETQYGDSGGLWQRCTVRTAGFLEFVYRKLDTLPSSGERGGREGTDHAVRAKSTRHFITTGFIIVLLCGSHGKCFGSHRNPLHSSHTAGSSCPVNMAIDGADSTQLSNDVCSSCCPAWRFSYTTLFSSMGQHTLMNISRISYA
jgi:hypothetical protein